MRLRGRNAYKLLALFVTSAVLCLVYISYRSNGEDEFIRMLQPLPEAENLNKNQLMNINHFEYLIENNMCNNYKKDILAIIVIVSYVGHDQLRAAHRQAVPQGKLEEMGLQRVFLLASIPKEEKFITQKQIEDEQKRFGDLLQGNFMEAYRNLSYKHVMGLRWAAINCSQAKFIAKGDDDIIYDVFQLKRYLESIELEQNPQTSSGNYLAGYIIKDKAPIRNQASKWYVTKQEYPENSYPAYLSGWLYFTNKQTALKLVNESVKARFFWIDDTWVTGVLRQRLNITLQSLNPWFAYYPQLIECCVNDLKKYNYECEYFVAPSNKDTALLIEFLHNVEKCYFDECIKRPANKTLKETCVGSAKFVLQDHGEPIIKSVKLTG